MTHHSGFRIRGRVQGVGFRWWTRSQALRLGLSGTVCNLDDGTVEVMLRGSPGAIAEMERLLHRGPPGAWVTTVEEAPATTPPQDGFHITR